MLQWNSYRVLVSWHLHGQLFYSTWYLAYEIRFHLHVSHMRIICYSTNREAEGLMEFQTSTVIEDTLALQKLSFKHWMSVNCSFLMMPKAIRLSSLCCWEKQGNVSWPHGCNQTWKNRSEKATPGVNLNLVFRFWSVKIILNICLLFLTNTCMN